MIQLRFWNRRAGALSALALALLAQTLLNQTAPGTNLITVWNAHTIHLVAYGLLALAMLLFGAAAAPMEDGRARKEEPTARPRAARTFNRTTVSLALAVLSYLASLALYLSAGESFAVRASWLAGPLLRFGTPDRVYGTWLLPVALLLWLLPVAIWRCSRHPGSGAPLRRWPRRIALLGACATAGAAVTASP